jgi:hypothetical protein
LCGDDRADARLVEQRGCERAHVAEEVAFELGSFECCCFDAAREAAQHELGCELVDACCAAAAQAATAVEQLPGR